MSLTPPSRTARQRRGGWLLFFFAALLVADIWTSLVARRGEAAAAAAAAPGDCPPPLHARRNVARQLLPPTTPSSIVTEFDLKDFLSVSAVEDAISGNRGRRERLLLAVSRLSRGACLKVGAIGASITLGHPYHVQLNMTYAYAEMFVRLLNARYARAHCRHVLHKTAVGGSTSSALVAEPVESLLLGGPFDILIIELSINDIAIKNLVRVDDTRSMSMLEMRALGTEFLLRRLLRRTQQPLQTAIIYLETSSIDRGEVELNNDRSMSRREASASPAHELVCSHYGVPLVYAYRSFAYLKLRENNTHVYDTSYAYSHSNIMADSCCHPTLQMHRVFALELLALVVEAERQACELGDAELPAADSDTTLVDRGSSNIGLLPLFMNNADLKRLELDEQPPLSFFDFSLPSVDSFNGLLLNNSGWNHVL